MSDRFGELLDKMRLIYNAKAADYGGNLKAAERFGVPAWVGCLIRANDKMARLQTFARQHSLTNESAYDSLLDLANYALLAYIELEREKEEENRILTALARPVEYPESLTAVLQKANSLGLYEPV